MRTDTKKLLPDLDKAKGVLVEILRQAGEPIVGTTKLFKIFYFAHLYYAGAVGSPLTNWPIVHMPNGPGIGDAEVLINSLRGSGVMELHPARIGPYRTTEYRIREDDQSISLGENEVDAIRSAVAFAIERTAVELSEITHDYSRSWNATRDGEPMDVFLDMIPEYEFAEQEQQLRDIAEKAQGIFA